MNFKTFYIGNGPIRYQEMMADPGSAFDKFYLIDNPERRDIVAIPDGCVDIQFVWEDGGFRGYVCGSFLVGKKSVVGSYPRCFGLKMRPGMQFGFLKKNAAELVGARIPLSRFLDISLLEKELLTAESIPEMAAMVCCFFRNKEIVPIPLLASQTARIILEDTGEPRISDLADSLGYSQRYVNSVFKYYFGVPLKKYYNIIRIQTAIEHLRSQNVMDVVTELGYYDQAHFIHDFKHHTSLTPKTFIDQVHKSGEKVIV